MFLRLVCSPLTFLFTHPSTPEIYTLSLHDALPIFANGSQIAVNRLGRVQKPRRRARARQGCREDRKSTRLNSSHVRISYAVFCLKKQRQRQPHPVQLLQFDGQWREV